MLNFEQLNEKVSGKGFRRTTTARPIDDGRGGTLKVYDYEHQKKLDMFSVYLDEFGQVRYAEYTKVDFDRATQRFSQKVIKLMNTEDIRKYLG